MGRISVVFDKMENHVLVSQSYLSVDGVNGDTCTSQIMNNYIYTFGFLLFLSPACKEDASTNFCFYPAVSLIHIV